MAQKSLHACVHQLYRKSKISEQEDRAFMKLPQTLQKISAMVSRSPDSCIRANSPCPPSDAGRSMKALAGRAQRFFCRTQLCQINKSPAGIYVQITRAKGPFGRKASICVRSGSGVMGANKQACFPPGSLPSHGAFVTQHFAAPS